MIPDLNQPVENPKLKALLNKRATAPQEAQLDVVNEIAEEIAMNAHFLAVVNFGGSPVQNNSDGTALFPEGATMSFPGLSLKDGSSCLPRIIRFVVFIDPHQGLIMLTDAVD
jgi:hypothetical protein